MLVSPSTPITAFKIGEKVDDPLAMYLNDLCTIPSNLAGNAGASFPVGLAPEDGLPVGLQVMAPPLADDRLYRVGCRPGARPGRHVGRSAAGSRAGADGDRMTDVTRAEPVRAAAVGGHRRRMRSPDRPYEDALAAFDPVLGLEVHVELNTASKMFCGCSTVFGAEPNTQTCPVCLGLPGSLPVVNAKAIESAIRIGLALNCSIAEWCRFARKNYFYPDMPKNYQISQYDEPIAYDGWTEVELDDGETYRVEHRARPHGGGHRQVAARRRRDRADPRRRPLAAGLQPLRRSADRDRHQADRGRRGEGAARWRGRTSPMLRELLRALGVSDVRMEQGSLRCDANLSLRPGGRERVRHPDRDQERQLAAQRRACGPLRDHPAGGGAGRRRVDQAGDPALAGGHRVTTARAACKETAEDYRYFPEPDLVPVAPTREWVEELRATLPEPPAVRLQADERGVGRSPSSRCAT